MLVGAIVIVPEPSTVSASDVIVQLPEYVPAAAFSGVVENVISLSSSFPHEMKEQLNKIYGEPEFESDQRCRYYDKENYLKISIVKRILPTEEYTEVIVSPYKYNRNK